MEIIGLLVLVALLLALGPVLAGRALGKARRLSEETDQLRSRLAQLENEVDRLKRASGERAPSAARRRPDPRASQSDKPAHTAAATPAVERKNPPPISKLPVHLKPEPVAAVSGAIASGADGASGAGNAEATGRPEAQRESGRPVKSRFQGVQLEQFMGVKLFAWVGGFALFLAIAFFVKYSFENNLISPELRVALGFLSGTGLLLGGVLLKRKAYEVTAQTLCATGVVVLYASSFAGHGFYDLIGSGFAFALMTLVTVTAFVLAVRLNAMVVAILGVLGGFLTPPLLSSGVDDPLALFGYIAILDVGLIAVALSRRWHFLVVLGALFTVFTQLAWAGRFFEPEKVTTALLVLATFNALFLGGSLAAGRRGQGDRWFAVAPVALPLVTFGFTLFFLAYEPLGQQPGYLFLGLLMAGLFLFAQAVPSHGVRSAYLVGGVAAFFVLALWTTLYLDEPLLNWALGAYLGFAILHTVLPLVIPVLRTSRWQLLASHLFPLLALMLLTLPFLLLTLATLRLDLTEPSPVFGLALLLVGLLLGLTRILKLELLAPVGLACALALEYVWYDNHFTLENAGTGVIWFVTFAAVFQVFPFCFRTAFRDRVVVWGTAALAGPLHFFGVYGMTKEAWPNEVMGLLPAAFALAPLVSLKYLAGFLPAEGKARRSVLAWFAGCALFFITLIFPIQFEKQWITLGWALEGVALLWLYGRLPHPGLRGLGLVLLALAFIRLAFNPAVLSYHPHSGTPILNWYLYAYGVVAACLFVAAKLLAAPRNLVGGRNVPPVLCGLGTVLMFLLVNIEIADYFSTGSTLTFQFSGDFARDMTYSISWALFALGLLVVGVARDLRLVRYAGMALMVLTLSKLFLHDLVRLSAPYRIGAFLAVAVISILASVLCQRFFASAAGGGEPGGDLRADSR